MDKHLLAFYAQGGEEPRLVAGGPSRLEYVRTLELLGRHLPPAPVDVLDVLNVGGGPGRYASWMAERGHRVTLRDIVPLHLEQASARAANGPSFDVAFGDARSLGIGDETFDAVLLMGPLYHLPDARDRPRALLEATRVTRPDGVVICTVITPLPRSWTVSTPGCNPSRSGVPRLTAPWSRGRTPTRPAIRTCSRLRRSTALRNCRPSSSPLDWSTTVPTASKDLELRSGGGAVGARDEPASAGRGAKATGGMSPGLSLLHNRR